MKLFAVVILKYEEVNYNDVLVSLISNTLELLRFQKPHPSSLVFVFTLTVDIENSVSRLIPTMELWFDEDHDCDIVMETMTVIL